MEDMSTMTIGSVHIQMIDTPGPTKNAASLVVNHIAKDCSEAPFLFSGSTLFIGGCGQIGHGGGSRQMIFSLRRLMENLPDDTLLFSGHENAVKNLEFAKWIEPGNF